MNAALTRLKTIILYSSILGLANSSCGENLQQVERKKLPLANPRSHVFKMPMTALRDTIVALFNNDQQYENEHLKKVFYYYYPEGDTENVHFITFNAETAGEPLLSKEYFLKANTQNDIYVHDFGTAWYSSIYHVKGKMLLFRTAYILKLESLDKDRTQITVESENPVVINGTQGIGPHGRVAREKKVNPTSVEEYTLLLYLAEKLGDKTMPPLNLPVR